MAQCDSFLRTHNIKPIARIDTAKSCEDIKHKNDKTKAAIASKLAAEIYDLEILAANIENATNNTTRFLVLSRQHEISTYNDKDIFLVFGKETKGLPEDLLSENYDNCIRIPMKINKRSLNLSNSVAVIAYEVLRQFDYTDLKKEGKIDDKDGR